jgi:hypothetical protein
MTEKRGFPSVRRIPDGGIAKSNYKRTMGQESGFTADMYQNLIVRTEITSAPWAQNDSPYLCPLNTESGECRLAIRMMSTGLLTLAPVY